MFQRTRAWWRFGRAQRLQAKGGFAEAAACYRGAAELQPGANVYLHLAAALAASGDGQAAISAVREAVALRPGDPVCGALHAVLLADGGDGDAAERALQALPAEGCGHPLAEGAALYLRLLKGERHAALHDLVSKPLPDNSLLRGSFLMRIEQIILEAEAVQGGQSACGPPSAAGSPDGRRAPSPREGFLGWTLGRTSKQLARAALRRGLREFERSRIPEAVVQLERAIALDPGLAEAKKHLGCALFEAGQYERSAALLKPFVEGQREDVLASFHYGAACCKLRRFEEALGVLDSVERGESVFDFQEWLPYFQGLALLGLRRCAEARQKFALVSDFDWTFPQQRAEAALDLMERGHDATGPTAT